MKENGARKILTPVMSPSNSGARVVHYLGNVGMTGVETFLLTLCAAQRQKGLIPSIICDLEGRDELLASAEAMDVDVHACPLALPISSMRGAARKIASATYRGKRVRRIGQILQNTGASVLHVHPVGIGGLDAFLAAHKSRVPFVVTHHATLQWFEPFRTKISDFTFWYEKNWAARIVCPYRAARDEMVNAGVSEKQAAVVPFCVDPRKFDQARAEESVSSSAPFRLFLMARMIEGKGHIELLRAIALLPHLRDELRVVFLGDGAERPTIEAEMRTLRLEGVVEMLGHVSNEKVPALMRGADAVVLPSYMPGETFPISLIEGMTMGLPTIGSRWFGIPDIVAHGETGFVVEPRDVVGLSKAIERLVTAPDLARKLGENGYQRAMKLFTAGAVADSYARIYREAQPLDVH
jgi:glycosyltransferase involved in cell wall biosynthesis